MVVRWTDKQKKVIDARGKNLLVSAAAGSGKTAVLVERIIRLITDSQSPVDIDKLLIVTFTNAAAAEMRERILKAIQMKSEEEPENEHLQKQQTYIHNAQITTIHSFCLKVIREHFNVIEIDPGFRVADEGELTLLKSDIINEILEDYYESGGEEFFEFIETYASGKGDENIEELILKLYSFSMSYPWPEKWLDFCISNYCLKEEEIFSSPWMESLLDYVRSMLKDYISDTLNAIAICRTEGGPYMYEEALNGDLSILHDLVESEGYDERVRLFEGLKFPTLSRKRDEGVDSIKREEVKNIRQKVKDGIQSIKNNYYFQSREEMLGDIRNSEGPTKVLIELVKEFKNRYSGTKREKNILDFNDIEHLALQILSETDEEGKSSPTAVAEEMAGGFEEIVIDEYQDSNLLQEIILKSVSKEQFGTPNIFMVGDVKQSIYKFRMARPELFMDKYNHYSSSDDALYQRINLDRNFRSRDNIIGSINLIFKQIMGKDLGDIDYDEENALYAGADYKELPGGGTEEGELLLVDAPESGKELEAQAIADRIHQMLHTKNPQMVVDRHTGEYREIRYSDIVILYRSLTGQAQVIEETLSDNGIPCYVESREGYFNALEIRIILSLLSVIDNPMQDIELAAVLKSPVAGLNSVDLARIKAENPEGSFYAAAKHYAEEGKDTGLREMLNVFFTKLDDYRFRATYSTIYELLTYVLNDTGYYLYVLAMPAGERRKANINMLKEKAAAYEKTSYKGVFNFIRYIEKLKKYKVDFAEASLVSENDDIVRIMSIHKSKGLEFPVVFLAGLGKKFNIQDSGGKIVFHPEFGIGVDFIDTDLRIKQQTLIKKSIALKVKLENLGEELRVLYVAMSRAKEKLILVGNTRNLEKQLGKWISERHNESQGLSLETLAGSSNYMDWIGYSLARHSSFAEVYDRLGIPMDFSHSLYNEKVNIKIKLINMQEILYEKIKDTVGRDYLKENLAHWDSEAVYNEKVREELGARLTFTYPFISNRGIHTKMSVTEIKRMSQMVDNEYAYPPFAETGSMSQMVPGFISKKESLNAAGKGSAYHRVLELLDFAIEPEREIIRDFIGELVARGKITRKSAEVVRPEVILTLLQSDLGKRLGAAGRQDKLYREKQYIMGIPASDINENYLSEEVVLIQGIIDAYFDEGELVVVDYKTDRVREASSLAERYRLQLDYYEKALTAITGKKVKEKIIYSLYLGKEVVLK